jgi:IS5 family transposase
MNEALHDVLLFLDYADLGGWSDRLRDASTISRFCFRHAREKKNPTSDSSTAR